MQFRNPEFSYVDVTLDTWAALVLERFPGATIHKAEEAFGGTRTAYLGNECVGDWDGGGDEDDMPGRIKRNLDV